MIVDDPSGPQRGHHPSAAGLVRLGDGGQAELPDGVRHRARPSFDSGPPEHRLRGLQISTIHFHCTRYLLGRSEITFLGARIVCAG